MERRGERLRLKCRLTAKIAEIDSVTSVWAAQTGTSAKYSICSASASESPEPDPDHDAGRWEGHPLRKDFPIHGHRY